MILRQTLNFAVHAAAGIAFGALAVIAAKALMDRREEPYESLDEPMPVEPRTPSPEAPPAAPVAP